MIWTQLKRFCESKFSGYQAVCEWTKDICIVSISLWTLNIAIDFIILLDENAIMWLLESFQVQQFRKPKKTLENHYNFGSTNYLLLKLQLNSHYIKSDF